MTFYRKAGFEGIEDFENHVLAVVQRLSKGRIAITMAEIDKEVDKLANYPMANETSGRVYYLVKKGKIRRPWRNGYVSP